MLSGPNIILSLEKFCHAEPNKHLNKPSQTSRISQQFEFIMNHLENQMRMNAHHKGDIILAKPFHKSLDRSELNLKDVILRSSSMSD